MFKRFAFQTRLWSLESFLIRSRHQRCSIKNLFLKTSQYSQENTCARASFLLKLYASTCNFIKKETLAQVFSSKFCRIFKNILFIEYSHTGDCLCVVTGITCVPSLVAYWRFTITAKKLIFLLRISLVNVNIFAIFCGLVHIY